MLSPPVRAPLEPAPSATLQGRPSIELGQGLQRRINARSADRRALSKRSASSFPDGTTEVNVSEGPSIIEFGGQGLHRRVNARSAERRAQSKLSASSFLEGTDGCNVGEALRCLDRKCDMQLELVRECLRQINRIGTDGGGHTSATKRASLRMRMSRLYDAGVLTTNRHWATGCDSDGMAKNSNGQESNSLRDKPIVSNLSLNSRRCRGSNSEESPGVLPDQVDGFCSSSGPGNVVSALRSRIEGITQKTIPRNDQKTKAAMFAAARNAPSSFQTAGTGSFLTSSGVMSRRSSVVSRAIRKRVWQFLEDRRSSCAAAVYFYLVTATILVGIFASIAHILGAPFEIHNFDIILGFFFLAETFARFMACPNRSVFFCSAYNIIDCLVCVSVAINHFVATVESHEDEAVFAFQVFFPILMLLKLLRRFPKFHLLVVAFQEALEALPVILYTLMVIALVCTGFLYVFEPRSNIESIPQAAWLTIVTLSTVGYGDVYPVSNGGKGTVACLIVVSTLYTAIPIGIVGRAFSTVWEDRERLQLLQEIRDRITQSGMTPDDIYSIFEAADMDGDYQLAPHEFKTMLPSMKIWISDEMCARIFEKFDLDGEGSIDFEELLVGLFPGHKFLTPGSVLTHLAQTTRGSLTFYAPSNTFCQQSAGEQQLVCDADAALLNGQAIADDSAEVEGFMETAESGGECEGRRSAASSAPRLLVEAASEDEDDSIDAKLGARSSLGSYPGGASDSFYM